MICSTLKFIYIFYLWNLSCGLQKNALFITYLDFDHSPTIWSPSFTYNMVTVTLCCLAPCPASMILFLVFLLEAMSFLPNHISPNAQSRHASYNLKWMLGDFPDTSLVNTLHPCNHFLHLSWCRFELFFCHYMHPITLRLYFPSIKLYIWRDE